MRKVVRVEASMSQLGLRVQLRAEVEVYVEVKVKVEGGLEVQVIECGVGKQSLRPGPNPGPFANFHDLIL